MVFFYSTKSNVGWCQNLAKKQKPPYCFRGLEPLLLAGLWCPIMDRDYGPRIDNLLTLLIGEILIVMLIVVLVAIDSGFHCLSP